MRHEEKADSRVIQLYNSVNHLRQRLMEFYLENKRLEWGQ